LAMVVFWYVPVNEFEFRRRLHYTSQQEFSCAFL
jgi:hypothetical protein